ncbi:MAG TPA: MG2 domain-containing protein, partial [Armatimonadaceae bacterium]|nr:MG2 domain-containing protein [Armatimonadaceae bacterium]
LLVSDIALVTKRSREDLLAYAVDVQKGTPVAGARVRAYRAGRRIDSEQTGADGRAALTLPRPAGSEDDGPVIVATRGRNEAVVRRAGYWWGDGAGRFVAHTVTDRTVYRPGDTVQFKGIVRRKRAAEGSGDTRRYDVPGGERVTVEMRDPTGALVARETKTTGARGTYWGSVELSPEGATGTYSLVADIGGEKHTHEVRVASYKKPEYSVEVTPAKTAFLRGETVEYSVQATYYFGTPVAGATVKWYAYRDADWAALYGDELDDDTLREYAEGDYGSYYGEMVEEGEATLDGNGKAVVRVPSVRRDDRRDEEGTGEGERFEPQAEVFRLTAEIEDAAQRSVTGEGSARVTAAERFVRVEPEGYVAAPGKPSEVYVTVRDLGGKPVPGAPVTLAVARSRWDEGAKKSVTTPVGTQQQATTGSDGRARLAVTPAQSGDLRLTATTRDAGGRAATDEADLWVTSDRGDDLDTDYGDLTILTDKRQYGRGETARVLLNASRTGQTALVTVEGDRVYRAYTVPLTKKSTVLNVRVEEGWGPNVFLAACYVRDKKFASSSAPLRVAVPA